MSKLSTKKPTTSFALSYGISILVVSLATCIGMLVWLFQVIRGTQPFSWASLIVYVLVFAFSLPIGLALLKVSQLKKKNETPH